MKTLLHARLVWEITFSVLATVLFCTVAVAEESISGDKSGFSLFNPTPRNLMREMSTDRPDTTESPFTVDAGHVQLELSLINYAYNKDDGIRTETWEFLPSNLKIGLLNNMDVQFVFTPLARVEVETNGDESSESGFGDDTQIRLKINLWGNDGPHPTFGETAFAIMPFVQLPTGSGDSTGDHVDGGIILPLAVDLPGDFGLGLMAEVDFVYNDSIGKYGIDLVHTATISHDIPCIDNLGGYLEYIGIAPHDSGNTYQAIGSGGLTYAISNDWILDLGGTIGLSESADDFSLFLGTSYRF